MGTWTGARLIVVVLLVAGVVGVGTAVSAHECETRGNSHREHCDDTPVYGLWRHNVIPLFTMEDRDDPERRREAERWRDEHGCYTQYCAWADWNSSTTEGTPNSLHVGMAADHSMTENAHQSENHGTGESNHDAHGGAVFADVCITSDEGTSYESEPGACEGPEDTRVVFVIKDHLACPLCLDEYHEVRPLDAEYTEGQMERSVDDVEHTSQHPVHHVCGDPERSNCPVEDEDVPTPDAPTADSVTSAGPAVIDR